MFTGIIQKVATVTEIEPVGDSLRIRVASEFKDLESGESIAVNGACLTVTEFDAHGSALFFVSPETLAKTNLGRLRSGARANLERAVTLSTRLSGHLVQGHVDGMGRLLEVKRDSESFAIRVEIPTRLTRYCVEKGSIALNGVSLTINFLEKLASGETALGITLIPHTWDHTQFSILNAGDPINVEVDVLAKYVESLTKPYGV